jgi:2'-hydroxyisoflavone reductase
MNILILGGTGFLGPAVVETLLARNHTPVLFNRGRTNADLFPTLEKLHGDRNADVSALAGRKFDAVVDTSGYSHGQVRRSGELLKGNIGQYVFISSVSVYDGFAKVGIDESHPVAPLPEGADPTKVTGQTFGPLKALAEQAATELFGARTTNIRPTLIVGPRDNSDRFTYWPHRIDAALGDRRRVLAPGNPAAPVQYIDVRDLAEFIVTCIEQGHGGTFNAVGPTHEMSMAELLYGIKAATTSDAQFVWVTEAFLMAQGVGPWMDMPLWVPQDADHAGFARVDSTKARALGLKFRPLADTAAATLAFARSLPPDRKWGAGLPPEKEAAVLAAWDKR